MERQKNEQTIRQSDYPVRFLRANGKIATNVSSSSYDSSFVPETTPRAPPGNPPRKHRPGFRVGTVVTTESAALPAQSASRVSVLPPISASSTNSFVSGGMNIEKPTNNATKQASITTKTTFRTSLKRVQSLNDQQKSK